MAEDKNKTNEGAGTNTPPPTTQRTKTKAEFPTKEQKAKAKELLKGAKGKIFVNVKGEFFTTENLASLSVKNKKDDYALAYENK